MKLFKKQFNFFKEHRGFFVFLIISMLIIIPGVILAINKFDEGWRANHGTATDVITISATGPCYKVTNTHASYDYFIPTKSAVEWNALDTNKPSGISIGSCCTPDCAGKECGPDGCGDTCGPGCPDDTACGSYGSPWCWASGNIIYRTAPKTTYDCNTSGQCDSSSDTCYWQIQDCDDTNQYCETGDSVCTDCECSVTEVDYAGCDIYYCDTYYKRQGYIGHVYECDGCFESYFGSRLYVGGGFGCISHIPDSCQDHDCLDGYCEIAIGPCLGNWCALPSGGTNYGSCCLSSANCVPKVTEPNVCSGGDLYDWENDYSCQVSPYCLSLKSTSYCQPLIGSGRIINRTPCPYGCITVSGWGNDYCKPAPTTRSCTNTSCSGSYNRVIGSNSCGGYVIATCIGSWTFDAINWSSSCTTVWESVETYTAPSSIPCP